MTIFTYLDQVSSIYKMLVEIHSTQQIYRNSPLLINQNQEVVQDKIKGWVTLGLIQQQDNLPITKLLIKDIQISQSQEPWVDKQTHTSK